MKTKLSFSCNTEPRTTQVSLNMMYYQEKILVLVQTSIALFWRRRLPARLERNIWQSSSSSSSSSSPSSSWSDNCTRIWIMELGLGVSHWSPLFWNSHHLLFSHSFRCHYRPLQMAGVLSIFRITNWDEQWERENIIRIGNRGSRPRKTTSPLLKKRKMSKKWQNKIRQRPPSSPKERGDFS